MCDSLTPRGLDFPDFQGISAILLIAIYTENTVDHSPYDTCEMTDKGFALFRPSQRSFLALARIPVSFPRLMRTANNLVR